MRIFLSVGTHEQPFARMIELADRLFEAGHDVTVQHGYSEPPRSANGFRLAPGDDIGAMMRQADAVAVHAGPATVLQALDVGRSPVVFPRSASFGEHVDDHQLAFAEHLKDKGLIRVAYSVEDAMRLLLETPSDLGALAERRARVAENRLRLARSLDDWLAK